MLLSKFSCSASITRLANCCACCATSHPTIKSPQDQKSNKQIAQPWKHWTILIFLDSVQSPSYDTQEWRFTNLLQKILAGHHFFMVLCTKLPSLNLLQNGKTVFSTLEAFLKPLQTLNQPFRTKSQTLSFQLCASCLSNVTLTPKQWPTYSWVKTRTCLWDWGEISATMLWR